MEVVHHHVGLIGLSSRSLVVPSAVPKDGPFAIGREVVVATDAGFLIAGPPDKEQEIIGLLLRLARARRRA